MTSRVTSPPPAAAQRCALPRRPRRVGARAWCWRWARWLCCCASCWGWTPPCHAQPAQASGLSAAESESPSGTGIALNWVRMPGAESCVSSTELMQAIEAAAGNHKLFVPASEASLSLDGYVARLDAPDAPPSFTVAFALSDASGTVLGRTLKVLPGRDCSVVTRAMVLMTDLRVNPDGSLAPPAWLSPQAQQLLAAALAGWSGNPELDSAERPAPPARQAPRNRAARSAPDEAAPAARADAGTAASDATPAGSVEASASSGLGVQPGLAFGLSLRATLVTPLGWPIELGFSAFPGRQVTTADARADVDLQRASLALCPLRPLHSVFLCAGAAYGSQSVTPSLAQSNPVSRALLETLAYAVLRLRVAGSVFASARFGLSVPLLRGDYRYENVFGERSLFRMAPLGGQADLGLGMSL